MSEELFNEENFGESTEMSSQTMDWGTIGDFILGTFVKARHGIETQFGENSIYEFLAEKGSFHKIVNKVAETEATTINKGETWNVWGRGDIFCGQANSLKPGQVVKLIFAEEKETSMGTAKIVKIRAPKDNEGKVVMNQEWLDAQGVTGKDF